MANDKRIDLNLLIVLDALLDERNVTRAATRLGYTQPTVSGVPVVQVQVTGTVPYMFNLVGTSFAVSRTVVFRDEGR